MMPGMQKTMDEWKAGTLKSSSGAPVKSQKQAIAIGLSEQRKMKKFAEGGYNKKGKTFDQQFPITVRTKEQQENDAARKADAEMAGTKRMKSGGATKKYARGGGCESRGKTRGKFV